MAPSASPGRSPATRRTVAVLPLTAIGGALWVPIYAHSVPKLGDFPFFYWFQLIWVPVAAMLCWLSYVLLRTKPAPDARPRDGGGWPT